MSSTRGTITPSSSDGFTLVSIPKMQLSEGPNPGVSIANGVLLVFVPDIDSPVSPSEFITQPLGSQWAVTIEPVVAGVVGASVYSQNIPIANNLHYITLDPATYPRGLYRVTLRDAGANIIDQWDFHTFDQNATSGSADVASINDAVRRIAGLLGYRQRTTYADYVANLGMPATTTVELLDGSNNVLASYRRKLNFDSSGQVSSETMAALDTNVL